ncbi:MAG: ISAzo13 family transposase, partial [Mesoflavibacter sp.]|nr:ISAzo13 family transposase [Mesoflavibacter sp.]
EHLMSPHVTRACQGVIFRSAEIVRELIESAETENSLKVTAEIIDKVYELKRKVKAGFKENMPIVFDEYLPKWNYRAIPKGEVI